MAGPNDVRRDHETFALCLFGVGLCILLMVNGGRPTLEGPVLGHFRDIAAGRFDPDFVIYLIPFPLAALAFLSRPVAVLLATVLVLPLAAASLLFLVSAFGVTGGGVLGGLADHPALLLVIAAITGVAAGLSVGVLRPAR